MSSCPDTDLDFTKLDRLTMVACGTAFYACLTAKYWFEQLAKMPVEVDIASEFRYREPPIHGSNTGGYVRQPVRRNSRHAGRAALLRGQGRQRSCRWSMSPESSIARESDITLPIHAGVEIGVASTKAFHLSIERIADVGA